MQEAAARSAISLYTPYIVIFVPTSLVSFKIVSDTDYIQKFDFASARMVSALISIISGLVFAVVLRPVLLSLTGI